jgi:hypothetical protein
MFTVFFNRRFVFMKSLVRTFVLIPFLVGVVGFGSISPVEASIVVTWTETGGDVVGTWQGSINLSGYTARSQSPPNDGARVRAVASTGEVAFFSWPANAGDFDYYEKAGVNSAAGIFDIAEIDNGDGLDVTGNVFQWAHFPFPLFALEVPDGYQSGQPLGGTMLFPGETIAGVFGTNLDAGPRVVLNDGVNTLTFQAVPEPSTVALLAGGVIAAAGAALRRRARRIAA